MSRRLSVIATGWWDYSTLDDEIVDDAARLTPEQMLGLSREGFKVVFYETLEELYLAEALEYIEAWRQSTRDNPAGICGPIGPTQQLPLVARLVNATDLRLRNAHFWGMDEWVADGKEVPETHPLSFARTDRELCFDRIRPELAMPEENLHFPKADVSQYVRSWDSARCVVMQGGQGDAKHWAFNDPVERKGQYKDAPPAPQEYLKLGTRVVKLHPATVVQNARSAAGGKLNAPKVKPTGQIVRSLGRHSRRTGNSRPSRFSVAVSRTPRNRYSSQWKDAARGLAAALGNAIAAKTGTPVGIVYMSGGPSDLKSWVPYTALSQAPSWREDYAVIGAKYPDTPHYEEMVRDYMASWKAYWEKDIASMIATRAVPEGWGAWGEMPRMGAGGSSTACMSYNIMTHSFLPTSLRGVVFLAGPASAEAAEGANFGAEMSALANSWKQGFAVNKGDDVPFFHTMPAGAKVTKPTKIKGKAVALKGGDWSPIEQLIEASK